jgi:hypothetical protein
MILDNKIIYVNGDSFTEGCDTANHMFPFPVEYFSLNDVNDNVNNEHVISAQHKFIEIRENLINEDKAFNDNILRIEKELRWSTTLGKILNRDVINMSSMGGSSMFAIAFRSIADINELIKRGYKVTDAIIQITSDSRFSIFQDVGKEKEPSPSRFGQRYYKLNSGNIFHSDIKLKNLISSFFEAELAEFNNYRWFHELYMLTHTLQSISPGIRVIFVDSIFYKNTIYGKAGSFDDVIDFEVPEFNHILDFKKEFDDKLELCMLDQIGHDEKLITAGLHFASEVHDRFAKAIAERYFNE